MNLWKWVTGTPAAVETGLRVAEKTADGVISGLDSLVFTKQERSEAGQKIIDSQLKFIEQVRQENSLQSRARREIALMMVGVFVVVLLVGIGLAIAGQTDRLNNMIKFLNAMSFGEIVLMIMGTYFFFHQAAKVWRK